MLEWYCGLTGWLKNGIPGVLLLISIIMYMNGTLWPFGFGVAFAMFFVNTIFPE